jgi:hypothetical protein
MTTSAFPILWVGPASSGKITAARERLCVPKGLEPRLQILMIGDYSARYWEFPTHMEIDVMDLSMMDKQILPEMLSQLLSTRDVTGGKQKVMILRRIHSLSPPAAIRLRSCLEEFVWFPGAPAMIWCTAQSVNAVVSSILDGFVFIRMPSRHVWNGKVEIQTRFQNTSVVPTLTSYVYELLRQMVVALEEGPPCLDAVEWIRARVYDMLGLMITGGELVENLTWATVRMASSGTLTTKKADAILHVLASVRWFPSYRTPLMLEMILVSVYNTIS